MRAFAAASVLAALLALAGCAGASPAPQVSASPAVATQAVTPSPAETIPATRADRKTCVAFAEAAAGQISKARLADTTGNLDVNGRLLAPVAKWIVFPTLENEAPVAALCATIGVTVQS